MTVAVHTGDVLDVLKGIEANSFDGVLTDPPYGLKFMSKRWDHGVPSAEVWAEVLRVCKPGAMLLAFGGTRTFHRLTCAIEDAGWEVRDVVCWLYGSGFPKSHDISKGIDKAAGAEREVVGRYVSPENTTGPNTAGFKGWQRNGEPGDGMKAITAPATPLAATWDGYGTALKPAWEPCIVAMKPTEGTFANNATKWGVAGINVDGCRIGTNGESLARPFGYGGISGQQLNAIPHGTVTGAGLTGRWPANLILDAEAAAALDEMSGETRSDGGTAETTQSIGGRGTYRGGGEGRDYAASSGGASRFFYTAKASRREREAGLEGLPERVSYRHNSDGRDMTNPANAMGDAERKRVERGEPGVLPSRNHHPTVKPLALCEYLARLILPPADYRDTARLLVPFCGSGSEMIGALQAGWRNVEGIEKEAEYVDIARRRLDWWQRQLRGNPRPLPDWIEADELEPIP